MTKGEGSESATEIRPCFRVQRRKHKMGGGKVIDRPVKPGEAIVPTQRTGNIQKIVGTRTVTKSKQIGPIAKRA